MLLYDNLDRESYHVKGNGKLLYDNLDRESYHVKGYGKLPYDNLNWEGNLQYTSLIHAPTVSLDLFLESEMEESR